jgi:acyl-CoA hydrolase/GNAT superfamily N-acetyltransferase
MDWQERYGDKQRTLSEAIEMIPKGKHLFIGSGACEPAALVEQMVKQHHHFADNQIVHLMTIGPAPYVEPQYADLFRHNAIFIGANVREAVHSGRADYTPVFLSQIPSLMRSRRIPIDVALIQVTPPDSYGYTNLGVSVDVVLAAIQSARLVIAQINPEVPRIHGSGFVPMDEIDAWVYQPAALPVLKREPPDEVATEIGRQVASLVEDGSTIQVGIGQVPDAVSRELRSKKDLGCWTEMLPDGVTELMENGNITGRYKTIEPRRVSASFAMGEKRTYDFLNRNPGVAFHPSDYINDPINIAKQHKMVAINGAMQIDLTGQVCSDSIGTKFYSGIGGQVDFIRGASMSRDGKPIIAVRSTAKGGTVSKIVATLDAGAGVVTSRGDVHYVVTEYGIADLRGKSIRERAMALISIAHPDMRADLLGIAKERHYIFPDQIKPRAPRTQGHEKRVTTSRGEKVLLRAIRETDEPKLSDMFYSFSDDTVYKRWLAPVPSMPHRNLLEYCKVDDVDNVAIVAEYQHGDTESEILGVGRYHLVPATGYADVGFVLRDDWQGLGLGTAMFRHIVEIAKQNGIAGLTGDVLMDNVAMIHTFHKAGLDVQSKLDGSVYRMTVPFPRKSGPTPSK